MPERYIKRVLDGDKEAFRYIIRKCQDGAFSLSVSILKDDMLAKEAIHKAFIRTYEQLHTFKHQSAFKTWFHRIVVNESFQIARKNRRIKKIFTDLLDKKIELKQCEIDELTEKDHLQYYVYETLNMMKPNESLVLRLFYLEEHTIEEIGVITGWPQSRIKVTLHRARKSMKTLLSEKFHMKPEELYL